MPLVRLPGAADLRVRARHSPQPETFIFGLAHGLLWIAMSLVCIAAARARVIPFWLAVDRRGARRAGAVCGLDRVRRSPSAGAGTNAAVESYALSR